MRFWVVWSIYRERPDEPDGGRSMDVVEAGNFVSSTLGNGDVGTWGLAGVVTAVLGMMGAMVLFSKEEKESKNGGKKEKGNKLLIDVYNYIKKRDDQGWTQSRIAGEFIVNKVVIDRIRKSKNPGLVKVSEDFAAKVYKFL